MGAVVKKPSEEYPHEMFGEERAEEMKDWLLKEFDAFPEARDMIRVTDAKDILERKVLDRPPIEKWSYCNSCITDGRRCSCYDFICWTRGKYSIRRRGSSWSTLPGYSCEEYDLLRGK